MVGQASGWASSSDNAGDGDRGLSLSTMLGMVAVVLMLMELLTTMI